MNFSAAPSPREAAGVVIVLLIAVLSCPGQRRGLVQGGPGDGDGTAGVFNPNPRPKGPPSCPGSSPGSGGSILSRAHLYAAVSPGKAAAPKESQQQSNPF